MFKLSRAIGGSVPSAMWQAYRTGKRASWLPAEDWESRLEQPLEAVRDELGITPPEIYREALQALPAAA